MAEDVYTVPDLTKKVRYRREREQETEDRGEREERLVDIYVSADDPGPDPDPDPDPATQQVPVQQITTQQQHGASDESRKNKAFKAATVCLGVLCVILLAGITGLGVHNSKLIKENNNLTKMTKDQVHLQSKYDNLAKDLEQMTKQKDDFQSRYNNVTAERDELKRRLCENNNLTKMTKDQVHLQSKYDNLAKDLEEMTNQKDNFQSRYNNVTAERDELKRRLCGAGWQGSGRGCYYSSTARKTWEESRKYCRAKQSDLIIINSKDELDFVNRVVNMKNQEVWLGLTDREEEGVWKWVDGTPLTSHKYWNPGEPNDYGGRDDCAVHYGTRSGWFDQPCTANRRWICEKVL